MKTRKHDGNKVKGIKEVEFMDDEFDTISINLVNVQNIDVTVWFENLNVAGKLVKFKLDTGVQVNILPKCVVNDVGISNLKPTSIILESFCGSKVKPQGILSLRCKYKNIQKLVAFVVVDDNFVPILRLSTCICFNLIQKVGVVICFDSKENFIENNSEIFEGLRKFKEKCKISLISNSKSTS